MKVCAVRVVNARSTAIRGAELPRAIGDDTRGLAGGDSGIMPELPEVELAARDLRRWCAGRTIAWVGARGGAPIRGISARGLVAGLTGRRIDAIARHGKQLFIELTPLDAPARSMILLAHLGMTGKFQRVDRDPPEHCRLSFRLDDGSGIGFVGFRRAT